MKKNLKRALMATFIISIWILGNSLTAFGAENSLANFKKVNTYSEGLFSDVDNSLWYGETVGQAYEYGIINGFNDGTFRPQGNLTVEQSLVIAANIHSIYKYGTGGAEQITQGSTWYDGAISYCKREGLIGSEFDSKIGKSIPITRAEMVHAWSKLLQGTDMQKQNQVVSLPDVSSSTPYGSEIIGFYEAGIVSGYTGGAFKPSNNITRAEASTIFMNLIRPDYRTRDGVYGSSEVNKYGEMNLDAQNKYIDQLLSQSQGTIYNKATGKLDIDYALPDLPAGFKWDITVTFSSESRGKSGSIQTKDERKLVNGHFKSLTTNTELSSLAFHVDVLNENGHSMAQYNAYYDGNGNVTEETYEGAPSDGPGLTLGKINPAWASQAVHVK